MVTGFLFFSSKILIQKSNPAADSHQMPFYMFNRDININSNLTGNVININVSNRKWDRVFKNGLSKICGRLPLNNFTWSIPEYFVPNVGPKA